MNTFSVKKGDVIELGEGHSSTAQRNGEAYFTDDGVAMLTLDGSPEFDLDHNDAWPVPESKPVEPQSQIARITEPLRRWLERKVA